MKRNLLQEAIADAKLIKDTALANAKLQLEEAFQPTLQRMISTKIQEEDGEEDLDIDINYDDTADEGGEDIGMASFEEEPPVEEPTEEVPTEEEYDPELEELFRELDGADDEMLDEPIEEGDEENWDDPIETVSESDEMEDEMVERVLERLLHEEEGLGDMLDMGPNKEDGAAYDETPPSRELNQENRMLKRKVKQLQKELNEALRAITTMKTAFNESNLLNTKSMYAISLIKKHDLTEGQRNKIIDSLDVAKNIREAKIIYATLSQSLNKSKLRRVNEGYASKSTPVIKNTKPNIINESMIKRMQQLANIRPLED